MSKTESLKEALEALRLCLKCLKNDYTNKGIKARCEAESAITNLESALSDDRWVSCEEKVPKETTGYYSDKVLLKGSDVLHIAIFDHQARKWYKVHDTKYIPLGYDPDIYNDCFWQYLNLPTSQI